MSLGACSWRQFDRSLCRFNLNLIHYHVSAHFHTGHPSFQNQSALHRDLSAPIRGNPIPSANSLPHAEPFRILNNSSKMYSPSPSDSGQQWRLNSVRSGLTSFYLSIRDTHLSVKELSVEAYLQLAKEAQINHLQQVMDMLAMDLLCHFPRNSDPEGFSRAAVAILSHATSNCAITPQRTLELFNALTALDVDQRSSLTPKAWDRIYSAAISHPELCGFSLHSIALMLLSQQAEQSNANYTWLTYQIIVQILMRGQDSFSQALTVFQQLVHLGHVPKLAQQLAQDEGGSFRIMIASTLVRGCLEVNWYIRAAELIMELLQNPRWLQAQDTSADEIRATALLGLEVLHVLVRSPTRQEIRTCCKLILALLSPSAPPHNTSHLVEIPHADILAFYEACYDYKLVGHAASVYVHLQSSSIRQRHYYPPPRNSALFWLFDHFADPGMSLEVGSARSPHKGYIRMARIILSDIIYRGIPVPIADRPRFIAIAAGRGFGFYARQLWEMYTVETDINRDVVRGNAQLLVPVVKLFRKLQEAWDSSVNGATKQVNDHADIHVESTNTDDNIITRSNNPPKAAFHAKKSVLPDAWRFANHVLNSYIATKMPLAMASQEDLNALARAHLILDHVSEGVEALSIVMERGDIPDAKDINVALGAIARYSPRHAVRMLERMIKRGVQPSASAFSATLHAALQTEDIRLVNILIIRARQLGHGALTPRAIAALVQAITAFKYTEDEAERAWQKSNLQVVVEIMEKIMKTPSTGRRNKDHGKDHVLSVKMGQKCVGAALTASEPAVAMSFWRLLIKDRVWWEDHESRSTRTSIGRCIMDRWKQGHLHDEEAKVMLQELGVKHVD